MEKQKTPSASKNQIKGPGGSSNMQLFRKFDLNQIQVNQNKQNLAQAENLYDITGNSVNKTVKSHYMTSSGSKRQTWNKVETR